MQSNLHLVLAWITLLLPEVGALPVLVLLFAVILAVDRYIGAQLGWPGYYRQLRMILSTAVMIMLAVAWITVIAA